MYGLVNSAMQSFVTEHYGEAMWHRVRVRAGAPEGGFVTMQPYPDELSYALVAAAHAELGIGMDDFLYSLGEHWIGYAAAAGHGAMLSGAGRSFVEVLRNMDAMHARIALTLPELRPPSIRVRNLGAETLDLHYYSQRPGLLPFLRGLLSGLAQRFSTPIEVEIIQCREQGHDHDVLRVSFGGSRA